MARFVDSETSSGGGGLFHQNLQHVDESIPGEITLALSVLQQAIADCRQPKPRPERTGWRVSVSEQEQAVAFLRDPDAISFWADLLGLPGDVLQRRLLAQAGLSEAAPHNGQRPGPAPQQKRQYTKRNIRHA